MTKKDEVIEQIQHLPDTLINEVLEYIRYLKSTKLGGLECGIQSESTLAKDWLSEEEEEAWKGL